MFATFGIYHLCTTSIVDIVYVFIGQLSCLIITWRLWETILSETKLNNIPVPSDTIFKKQQCCGKQFPGTQNQNGGINLQHCLILKQSWIYIESRISSVLWIISNIKNIKETKNFKYLILVLNPIHLQVLYWISPWKSTFNALLMIIMCCEKINLNKSKQTTKII